MLLCSTQYMTHGYGSERIAHQLSFLTHSYIDSLKECSVLAYPNLSALLTLVL